MLIFLFFLLSFPISCFGDRYYSLEEAKLCSKQLREMLFSNEEIENIDVVMKNYHYMQSIILFSNATSLFHQSYPTKKTLLNATEEKIKVLLSSYSSCVKGKGNSFSFCTKIFKAVKRIAKTMAFVGNVKIEDASLLQRVVEENLEVNR